MTTATRTPGEYALWGGAIGQDRPTFATPDRLLCEGQGVRVRDAGGRWLLDSRSSLRTLTFGYSYEPIVEAARAQLARLPYAEIVRYARPSDVAVEYANALVETLPERLTRVRFTTSGSRMVDESILLSRFVRVSGQGQPRRTAVVANTGAWHGQGGLSSAATGYADMHDWAGPLSTDFHHVPPNDLAALQELLDTLGPDRISAFLLEPVLGVGGVVLEPEYLRGAADLARRHGIHVILDEVTTGVGRLGSMSYGAQLGVEPDLLVLGKGLTSGYVPVSALAVGEDLYQQAISAWPKVFPHASTNDGHPAAMAAGLAVLAALADGKVYQHVTELGEFVRDRLTGIAGRVVPAGKVLGAGLMQFLCLNEADGTRWASERTLRVIQQCEERGLLIDCVYGRVVFTPPLITTQEEADEMLTILEEALAAS